MYRRCSKNGINLLLFSGNNDNLNSVVDFVDGFICYGRPRNKQLVEQLKQVAKHVVTVDFNIGRDASVNVNNQQASFDIAKHALQKNDDRVAILGLRLLDNDVLCRVYEHHEFEAGQSIAHQRLRGYHQQSAMLASPLVKIEHGIFQKAVNALPALPPKKHLAAHQDQTCCCV